MWAWMDSAPARGKAMSEVQDGVLGRGTKTKKESASPARRHERYLKNREKILAQQAGYRQKNRERRAAYSRQYYAEHTKAVLAHNKEYRDRTRERRLDHLREKRKGHPEIFAEYERRRYIKHREKRLNNSREWHRNNFKKRYGLTNQEWQSMVSNQKDRKSTR